MLQNPQHPLWCLLKCNLAPQPLVIALSQSDLANLSRRHGSSFFQKKKVFLLVWVSELQQLPLVPHDKRLFHTKSPIRFNLIQATKGPCVIFLIIIIWQSKGLWLLSRAAHWLTNRWERNGWLQRRWNKAPRDESGQSWVRCRWWSVVVDRAGYQTLIRF